MKLSLLPKITYKTFLASLIALSACQNSLVENQRPQPLPQDSEIQVYFNQNQAQGANYTEPYRQITRPGDDLEQIIIDEIQAAQETLDVAIQELRLPKIAQALVEKKQAGVRVRVILENNYSRPLSNLTKIEVSKLETRERQHYQEFLALVDTNNDGYLSEEEISKGDALIILQKAGVPVIDDTADGSKGSGLMHHKFVIIDGNTILTGSNNWTTSGIHGDFDSPQSRGNANNLLKINNPTIASLFQKEFNLMWGDGIGNNSDSLFGLNKPLRSPQTVRLKNATVAVQFSPTSPTEPWLISSNGLISKTISKAEASLDLALFVFSEQKLANSMENIHQRGVNIRALIDPSFAFRYYSEGLDMLGVALSNKCQYEQDNRPWQFPITTVGMPQLPPGDRLHHKFGVVDRETVITGSHNWSEAANELNDETLLIIQSSTIAAHFTREFERLYQEATLGNTAYVQQKNKSEEASCNEIKTISSPLSDNKIINLNTASKEELEALPGIGPKLAEGIIETRQQQPFTSLEDLQRVSGIGPSKAKKLDGQVSW